jgi:hypothetical protein
MDVTAADRIFRHFFRAKFDFLHTELPIEGFRFTIQRPRQQQGAVMGLRELIEGFDGRLSKADSRVVCVLLASPQEGTFLSDKDVARRASVHPTSAVRLAQILGFTGYRDLRAKLQQDISTDLQAGRNSLAPVHDVRITCR